MPQVARAVVSRFTVLVAVAMLVCVSAFQRGAAGDAQARDGGRDGARDMPGLHNIVS